jgi:triacylglycerol lipase
MPRSGLIDATYHFDLKTAQRLAAAAELVYAEPHVVERTAIQQWRSSRFCFFDVEATQCVVAADQRMIIVCFRGTETDRPEDWIVDIDFDLVEGPMQGRVHAGFYEALSCVWQMLDEQVRRLQAERPRQLWVTGHSLGAALATLAVARWREMKRPVSGLYVFGQPRTGDETFARNFDFAFRPYTFRIVNNLDIVTRTPPRSFGYRHLGSLIYITESGDLTYDVDQWQRFLNGWHGAIEMILDWGREGVEDHSMILYRQRIESALESQSIGAEAETPRRIASLRRRQLPALLEPRRRAA